MNTVGNILIGQKLLLLWVGIIVLMFLFALWCVRKIDKGGPGWR